MLVDRRLVMTAQGKGTFVRSLELGEAVFRLQQLTDQWQDSSIEVRMLEASVVPAGPQVARTLEMDPGERTVLLRRLFRKDNRSFMYHKEHVAYDPRRPWVESQLRITSLDGLLHATGGQGIARAELSVSAVNLEPADAGLLQMPAGAAAFSLEHLFRDYEGSPVSWGWFLCRSDEFRLVTQLGAGA
jgi:GntR family transcriptional regulator